LQVAAAAVLINLELRQQVAAVLVVLMPEVEQAALLLVHQ
jgi:hypothetical protein